MISKSIPFCRYVCLLLLWLGTATTAFPQLLAYDTPEQRQQSLNAALKELETQHQVNFTYRSEITDGKFVDPSKLTDNQASLDDKLDYCSCRLVYSTNERKILTT